MENEAIADEILSALKQMLEAAGPEWTIQFLQAGIEEAGQGGEPQPQQNGPPPMPPGRERMGPPPMPGGLQMRRPQ
jgi:hypothetical protein